MGLFDMLSGAFNGAPTIPTVTPPAPKPVTPVPTPTPRPTTPPPSHLQMAPPIDIMQFFKALTGLYHPDPLGAVARANSRVPGLTPQADWDAMFTPTSQARQMQMTDHPSLTRDQVAQQVNQNSASGNAAAAMAQSNTPQLNYQTPALGPVQPGTFQADQVAGKSVPAPHPLQHLFNLFGV